MALPRGRILPNSPALGLAWRLAAFLVAAAAFGWAISLPPVYVPDETAAAPPPGPRALPGAGEGHAPPPADPGRLARIAAAPLFLPDRKPWQPPPPPPPKEEAEPAAPPLSGYRLVGVVISGTQRSALIKGPSGDKTLVLQAGQTLDGWELKQVTKDGAQFEAGDQAYELAFPRPAGRKG